MKEDYVSYQVAARLKELGFSEPTMYYYKDDTADGLHTDHNQMFNHNPLNDKRVSAPTQDLARKWIEETYGYIVDVRYTCYTWSASYYGRVFKKNCNTFNRPVPFRSDDRWEVMNASLLHALSTKKPVKNG